MGKIFIRPWLKCPGAVVGRARIVLQTMACPVMSATSALEGQIPDQTQITLDK